jgi:aminoglycoside 6-adenylyltransferase
MPDITQAYEALIERFVRWAQAEDNLRAALVIGSRARTDHPADEWSDLDILFFSDDPTPYWQSTAWMLNAGDPMLSFSEPLPGRDGLERRALYDGGLDVDFVPLKSADLRGMLEHGLPPDFADMLRRGSRTLLDKDGLLEKVLALDVPARPSDPPAESVFLNVVHDFWFHTVWTAKHLRRGELWWGKGCCDGYLKNLLRQMMEWHAQAMQPGADTWMRGRFIEEWVDPRAREALPAIYARYDESDIWYALSATMDLFRWLSQETAAALGYTLPIDGMDYATLLVRQMDEGRSV